MGEIKTTDEKPKLSIVTSGNSTLNSKKKKGLEAILIIVLFILIFFGVFSLVNHKNTKNNNKPTIATVCSSSILKSSSSDFALSDVTQLGKEVNTIKKLPNYQNDPNCLYVIVKYYINTNNAISAQNYLNNFNHVYQNEPLNIYLNGYGNATFLREAVDILNIQTKEAESHSVGESNISPEAKK
jgi:hypothetical protein